VKKFLVALILAVILTATLATPVFAGDPPDPPGPGGGKGTIGNEGLYNAWEKLSPFYQSHPHGYWWIAEQALWGLWENGPPCWVIEYVGN